MIGRYPSSQEYSYSMDILCQAEERPRNLRIRDGMECDDRGAVVIRGESSCQAGGTVSHTDRRLDW